MSDLLVTPRNGGPPIYVLIRKNVSILQEEYEVDTLCNVKVSSMLWYEIRNQYFSESV